MKKIVKAPKFHLHKQMDYNKPLTSGSICSRWKVCECWTLAEIEEYESFMMAHNMQAEKANIIAVLRKLRFNPDDPDVI